LITTLILGIKGGVRKTAGVGQSYETVSSSMFCVGLIRVKPFNISSWAF